MIKRRRVSRLTKSDRFIDRTRRRVARKAMGQRLVHRRIKQTNIAFEEKYELEND